MSNTISWFDIFNLYTGNVPKPIVALPTLGPKTQVALINSVFPSIDQVESISFESPYAVSGFVISKENQTQALVVCSRSTNMSKRIIFQGASLLYAYINNGDTELPVYALTVNNKYTSNNAESLYDVTDITKDAKKEAFVLEAMSFNYNLSPPVISDPTFVAATSHLPSSNSKLLTTGFERGDFTKADEIPFQLLNTLQRHVHSAHLLNKPYIDRQGLYSQLELLVSDLENVYFLDFEATQFLLPTIPNVRPYEQVAFQYSSHHWNGSNLSHKEFVSFDLNCERLLAEQLVLDITDTGSVLTYNAAFERMVLNKLARKFPDLSSNLLSIASRLVDLHPIFKSGYYDPKQMGSWSLKKLLPCIVKRDLYSELDGVSNGQEASALYQAVVSGDINSDDATKQALPYCELDTLALVYLFEFILNVTITEQ